MNYQVFPTLPFTYLSLIDVGWQSPAQSSINAFGFVWTDGFDRGRLEIGVAGEVGCQYSSMMDGMSTGETSEDQFVGFVTDSTFFQVQVLVYAQGDGDPLERFELDHVQFGQQLVPEPSLEIIGIALVAVLSVIRECLRRVA